MNDVSVGELIRQSTGSYQFSYCNTWLENTNARSISLSLPLIGKTFHGEVVANFFDNLLPDSELIRKRIQARFQVSSNNSFDLLSQIGADCVGALQLLTEDIKPDVEKIQAQPLNDHEIAGLIKNYRSAPLGMDKENDFCISIAGAQEKTALLWHENQWCLPLGATPTSHIFKLPIGFIDHAQIDLRESVENEWLCLQVLSAFGLPVNQAEIKNFEDVKVLVVKRFDRRWSKDGKWLMRLPQEDMCQSLGKPSALKYESDGGPGIADIMGVLQGGVQAKVDRENFMKSTFLFWMLGAIDGHAKNFSVFLQAKGRYQLTPLYDVISCYPLAANKQLQWQKLKMAMSLKSKNRHYHWDKMLPRHWLAMAEYCRFSSDTMRLIMEDVCDNVESVIDGVESRLPDNFPTKISDAIFLGMRKVKDRCKISN